MSDAATAFSLAGRTAVVTGAARGIGAAVAGVLAEAGAHLALCDRDAEGIAVVADALVGRGTEVHVGVLDVRDADAVGAFVDGAAARFGPLHVLVNNAGGGFAAPFLDVSAKGEDALVRENFSSVAACIRAFVPHVPPPEGERGGGGAIVNITSIEAHRAAPGFAVYAAMKAAVANLTESLALELGDRRIRVTCVAPDVIPTPGIGVDLPVTTPLPYAGRAVDVAHAVRFLASDAAAFVTGTTLLVDGGNAAAGGWHRGADGSFTPSVGSPAVPPVAPGDGSTAHG